MGCLKLHTKTNETPLKIAYRKENKGDFLRLDYYPFACPAFGGGSQMPGRQFNVGEYRYGFNGQEQDNELSGTTGGYLEYKFREYDTRIVRMWSIDPIAKQYPELTPYQHSSLNPIWKIELEGLEGVPAQEKRNEEGMTVGYTTAQSSTYTEPNYVLQEQSTAATDNTATVQVPYRPEGWQDPDASNQTTIGPDRYANNIFMQKQRDAMMQQYEFQQNIGGLQAVHPISYGGQGLGPYGLARCPFIQASAMTLATGGVGTGLGLAKGFFMRGGLNATMDFGVQTLVYGGDISKVDYADVGFAFVFNKPGIGMMFSESLASSSIDIYGTDKGISIQSPFLGNKGIGNSMLEFGVRSYFGGIGTSFRKNLGGNFSPAFNSGLDAALNLSKTLILKTQNTNP